MYDAEQYLDSRKTNCEIISITGTRILTNIPSIIHLKKAKYLNVNHNSLTELPELPKTLKQIVAHTNQITHLPSLPKGLYNLRISDNQLTQLPPLPKGLHQLEVCNNPLQSLPRLPATLHQLSCSGTLITELPQLPNGLWMMTLCRNTHLNALPVLPETLRTLYMMRSNVWSMKNIPANILTIEMKDTPIYEILRYNNSDEDQEGTLDIDILRSRLQILNRFRELYYSLRFKQKFRDLLWMRVRLPRIERVNHPDELRRVLITEEGSEDEESLEEVMENFGM